MGVGREIRIRGRVQGVGFRPFVWRLANRLDIRGEVLNDPQGVLIRATGTALDAFEEALREKAPPLARIDSIESSVTEVDAHGRFRIMSSQGQGTRTGVTPDAAVCVECRDEIQDAGERRHRYAFANCTQCGPRFSIMQAVPYDRANTTMAAFGMCSACRAEYEDAQDRRFHAQPIACPDCGPQLWMEPNGSQDPIEDAAARLREGQIVAIKGVGGFHLAVDALNDAAVERLRARKKRPVKPLALMGSMDDIRAHTQLHPGEAALLSDRSAPIVLLARGSRNVAEAVAPGQARLGWMLPYTPLHFLLIEAFGGPLVMTSANASGAPQVITNEAARDRLAGIADAFVMHDRDIARRLDDSVEALSARGRIVHRRARGRAPGEFDLPDGFETAPPITAFGGLMKASICIIKDGRAVLGQHLGDLDNPETRDAFLEAERDYCEFFDHAPQLVACDLHPDYFSSRHAVETGLPVVHVQHHHAHLAACLGENGWPLDGGPVAAIILDGFGMGSDDTAWGGEVLVGDYRGFERIAHLHAAPLPGGDAAAIEPWRNLLARLDQSGLRPLADELLEAYPVEVLRRAVARGINAPISSSAGRLFDAFAAGLGLVPGAQSYEGEAAMLLEALATQGATDAQRPYPFAPELDPAPLFHGFARDRANQVAPAIMAWRFHAGLAQAFASSVKRLVAGGDVAAIALSGGCFQNMLLRDLVIEALGDIPVLVHTRAPANDGGLALGQALVAAAKTD